MGLENNLTLAQPNCDDYLHRLSDGEFYYSSKSGATLEERDSHQHAWFTPYHHGCPVPEVTTIRITSTTLLPAWFSEVISRCNHLLSLSENWDTYGAKKININAVVDMVDILSEIMSLDMPMPSVVPTNTGNVQLEWHARGIDLEIEVAPNKHVDVFFEDQNKVLDSWEGEFKFEPLNIPEHLNRAIEELNRRTA